MSLRGKILVVDDQEEVRTAVRIALEMAGFEVMEAEDGAKGVDMALTEAPDLVICDIDMPMMDGFEVLHAFREQGSTRLLPFVFLTGKDGRDVMRRGMDLGADDFITKPFSSDELISAVYGRLRRREHHEEEISARFGELRSSISLAVPHELRTPLTGILGFGEILKQQKDALTPEEVADIADHVLESGRRLQKTLEKFWTYTQLLMIAADKTAADNLRQERIQRGGLMLNVVAREHASAAGRPDDLRVTGPDFSLNMAERHFVLMMNELLNNALKFSARGTVVKVETEAAAGNPSVLIRVCDQGRGMMKDQIAKVGAFVQFDRDKQEQQGLGLGVAIARQIVQLYGGSLDIESDGHSGTTMTLTLPALPVHNNT